MTQWILIILRLAECSCQASDEEPSRSKKWICQHSWISRWQKAQVLQGHFYLVDRPQLGLDIFTFCSRILSQLARICTNLVNTIFKNCVTFTADNTFIPRYLTFLQHGDFDPTNQANESFIPCASAIKDFTSCFLFSLETQHTIGYGVRYI